MNYPIDFVLHTCPALSAPQIDQIKQYAAEHNYSPLELSLTQLCAVGFSGKKAELILEWRKNFQIEKYLERLAHIGARAIHRDEPGYPSLLREIHDSPHFLFVQGDLIPEKSLIAVVGTRHPSPYGAACTKAMTETLVQSGFGIVSGLAHGIDSIAHQEALRDDGYTVAVLAHGHNKSTPREHTLAQHIVEGGGAVITEHLPHVHAEKHYFPIRNRIIAGLARATLIIEAARKSGTMITAQCAVRENRDVLAVPGPVTSPLSEGPHSLIADGAACIYSRSSLREALGIHAPEQLSLPTLDSHETTILKLIHKGAHHLDQILEESHLPLGEITSILRQLVQKRIIATLPGNRFTPLAK